MYKQIIYIYVYWLKIYMCKNACMYKYTYIYYHMCISPNQLLSSKNSYSSMKQKTTFSQSASGHAESPFFATIEYPHTISNFHIHLLQGRRGGVWFEGSNEPLRDKLLGKWIQQTYKYIADGQKTAPFGLKPSQIIRHVFSDHLVEAVFFFVHGNEGIGLRTSDTVDGQNIQTLRKQNYWHPHPHMSSR